MKKIYQKKTYCAICGSTKLLKKGIKYLCLVCGARMDKPKETKLKFEKKPKYVG